VRFAEHLVLAAVEVDECGQKHMPGLRQRATENSAAVRVLLAGSSVLNPNRSLLIVVYGARALHKALGGRYVAHALQSQYTGFSNLSTMHRPASGTNKMFSCGAGLGLLDVDGNGDVHLCHRFPGVEEHKCANVEQGGIDYGRLTKFVNRVPVDNKPVCHTCWFRRICGEADAITGRSRNSARRRCSISIIASFCVNGPNMVLEHLPSLNRRTRDSVEKRIVRSRGDVPKELS
jgi:radical SAM protein with 4Fe4S-binding SPASM domain